MIEIDEIFEIGRKAQWEYALGIRCEYEASEFSEKLLTIISQKHEVAVQAILAKISHPDEDVNIVSDVLQTIGQSEDKDSHSLRLEVLCEYLYHKSPRIRHGAIHGLSILNDPASIPSLEYAFGVESTRMLHLMLKQVLEYMVRKN
jgi:hypothetical protein